jgi:hypothetical protein
LKKELEEIKERMAATDQKLDIIISRSERHKRWWEFWK